VAEPQRMYGWKETARILEISVRTLEGWVEEGRFPKPHKNGKTVRWFSDEILEWQFKFKNGLLPEPEPKKRQKKAPVNDAK